MPCGIVPSMAALTSLGARNAGESQTAKLLRCQLIDDRGLNKTWVKAAGYWKRGAVSIHETHND
jgi:hypothetical protein